MAVYAIGVFTGFTMAGAGMTKYHLIHRSRGWRHKLVINGSAAVLSGIVVRILVVAKFSQGAWTVVVLFPVLTLALIRLEPPVPQRGAPAGTRAPLEASEMPILRRHVVLVFVDRLDLATARAIQYARSLDPDEVRAVHFLLDNQVRQAAQGQLGAAHDPPPPAGDQGVPRPPARAGRGGARGRTLADGDTEVSVLLPRRIYSWGWGHLLHDRTADRLAAVVGRLPHATATVVPFQLGKGRLTRKTTAAGQGPPGRARKEAPS